LNDIFTTLIKPCTCGFFTSSSSNWSITIILEQAYMWLQLWRVDESFDYFDERFGNKKNEKLKNKLQHSRN